MISFKCEWFLHDVFITFWHVGGSFVSHRISWNVDGDWQAQETQGSPRLATFLATPLNIFQVRLKSQKMILCVFLNSS